MSVLDLPEHGTKNTWSMIELLFFSLHFFTKEKMTNFEPPHLRDETDGEQEETESNELMKPLKQCQARGN